MFLCVRVNSRAHTKYQLFGLYCSIGLHNTCETIPLKYTNPGVSHETDILKMKNHRGVL